MSAPLAVLLVEDDPTAQSIALSMLRHLGIEADVASDGAQGVRAAAERAYDLILMDMSLPVMDGWEATKALKAAGKAPERIVLGLSDGSIGQITQPFPEGAPSVKELWEQETGITLDIVGVPNGQEFTKVMQDAGYDIPAPELLQ